VVAADLDPAGFGVERDQLDAVLRLLLQARLVRRADDGPDPERDDQELGQWTALDLLFHARTRLGRRGGGYGGTYPFAERFPEPPAMRPAGDGEDRIALPRPDLDAAIESDPPLARVVETRRSIREHDDEKPITVGQLSELLFRTNRVRSTVDTEGHGSFALRPYPNGGALYELDIYPAVRLCEGLAPGLYRHDPVEHALAPVAPEGPMLHGLLGHARAAALMEQRPQVLLVIAARFPRVSWKYEAMPYALTLKHVGVLYQTLYLAATAMGLAPCGLGGGDSDLFARAAGLPYAAETSVGEFIVGSRPENSTGPGIEAVAAPTPDY
jgi:SagB-type dehydrogenase family enzyme